MMEVSKVLLYCTKAKPYLSKRQASLDGRGKQYLLGTTEYDRNVAFNGLVCFECDCREAFKVTPDYDCGSDGYYWPNKLDFRKTGLDPKGNFLEDYGADGHGGLKTLYAYHFENVKPIDPMPITKLYKDEACTIPLTRAPQSYCFAYQKKMFPVWEAELDCDGNQVIENGLRMGKWQGQPVVEKVLVFSIRSHWLCKIANGEQDLEVRKTRIQNAGIEYK